MNDFLARLSSRKFLLTIGAVALKLLYPETPDEVFIPILAFIGVEGGADIARAFQSAKVTTRVIDKDIALIKAGESPLATNYSTGAQAALPQQQQTIVPGGQ